MTEFKVKDVVRVTTKDRVIDGYVSAIVDKAVYSVKFLINGEEDIYWIQKGDIVTRHSDLKVEQSKVEIKEETSQRFNQGKTQLREVDPNFIMAMGDVLTKSRNKYDAFNWQKPTKLSTPYDSAMRHLMSFQAGQDIDPDDGLPHLIKAAVNLMFMHYHITRNPEYSDDRGFKEKK